MGGFCGLGLSGVRILVTASSSGIGFGVAKVVGSCGARVAITGRDPDRLRRAAEKLDAMGVDAHPIEADLSVEGAGARLVREAVEALGGLDSVVFIPPPPPGGRFLELGMDSWRASYRLLVEAGLEIIYESISFLKESRNPSITVITSIAAWEPLPGIATSSVLRPALHGLVTLLARELGSLGIRVNGIVPGYILTDRLREVAAMRAKARGTSIDDELKSLAGEVPLGRVGAPEDIGWLVAFLASPQARYINGALIPVSGGLHRSTR